MPVAWLLWPTLNRGLRTFDNPRRRLISRKSANRADLPADLLGFVFLPVETEGLLVPLFGFLLQRKLVLVRAVHVVEGHLPSPWFGYGGYVVCALLRPGSPAMGRQGVAKR